MSQAARLVRIFTMLRAHRHGIPRKRFLEQLGVTKATFFRDLAVLRDLRHPIVYDRTRDGYVLDERADSVFLREELPGVMLTAEECYALLTLHNVLRSIDPGFLEEFVEPLRGVLKQIVHKRNFSSLGLNRKVRLGFGEFAKPAPAVFSRVAEALVRDRRLGVTLEGWSSNPKERVVSPQRIELGREGWVLHVVDHRDGRVRAIPLPQIASARVLGADAERRPEFDDTSSQQSLPLDSPPRSR
jgi:predicted DNA-binding transcriptional regulator YafY